MNQLPLRLVTTKKQSPNEKRRHMATARHYAKRYARTRNPALYRLSVLHLKAGLA